MMIHGLSGSFEVRLIVRNLPQPPLDMARHPSPAPFSAATTDNETDARGTANIVLSRGARGCRLHARDPYWSARG